MSFPEHRKSTEGKEKYGEINATYWVTVLLLCLLLKSNTTHECHLFRQSKASVFSHVWQPPVPSVSLEPQTFHRFQLGVGQNQLSKPTGRHYFNWCTLAGKQQRKPSPCRCGLSAYCWSEQRVLQRRLPAAKWRRARRITAASKYTFISCQASSDQLVCQSTLTLNRQINQEYDATVVDMLLSHTSKNNKCYQVEKNTEALATLAACRALHM